MINSEELIFAVDENNNPIEPVARKVAHKNGIWHRTTDIAVVNSQDQILCSKRSMLKDTEAGKWDVFFGGHMAAGDKPEIGAYKELKEESGLDAPLEDLKFLGTIKHINNDGNNKEFRYVYLYRWNGNEAELHLEKDEVEEVRWFSLDEIVASENNTKEWTPMPSVELLKLGLKY